MATLDLAVQLGRLSLSNPILVASGTFGYAKEAEGFVPLHRLGGIVPKTVTVAPRAGNRPPRIVETASGMLNSIGLDNDGIEHFLAHHLPILREVGTKIIINVAGKSDDEFGWLGDRIAKEQGIAAAELNLSCPNVSGGIDFATNPERAAKVISLFKSACDFPILAKLTPNVTDIVEIASAAKSAGADAVTLINTLLGTAIDWRKSTPILGNVFGGLSGPAIKPVALRCVLQVSQRVKMPIVAAGGIANIDDVMEFLIAGASAIQVGTANFYDPSASVRILDQLEASLNEIAAERVTSIIGTVKLS